MRIPAVSNAVQPGIPATYSVTTQLHRWIMSGRVAIVRIGSFWILEVVLIVGGWEIVYAL